MSAAQESKELLEQTSKTLLEQTSKTLRDLLSNELYNSEHEIAKGQEGSAREALRAIADRICKQPEFGPDSKEYETAWSKYENTKTAWDAFVAARAKVAGMSDEATRFREVVKKTFGFDIKPGEEQDGMFTCGDKSSSEEGQAKYDQILPAWSAFYNANAQ